MKERLAERFALKHQEVRMIDSEAKNLQYMVCDGGDGLVVSGLYGMTGLTLSLIHILFRPSVGLPLLNITPFCIPFVQQLPAVYMA